jgi:hypothetical protein
MKKEVNVFPENESNIEQLVYSLYGSPISWVGGNGLIIKGYQGFDIRSEKGFEDKDYKTKIIFQDSLSKDEIKYLTKIATVKGLSFLDVDNLIEEAKKNLSWKLREVRA